MASAYLSGARPDSASNASATRGPYGVTDFAQGNPTDSSPLAQSLGQPSHLHDDLDNSIQGSSTADDNAAAFKRSASSASTAVNNSSVGRSGTLKKRSSIRRTGSLKRSSSRRSLKAGSIKGLIFDDEPQDANSVFHTPIPTSGSPTEILADRFQAWRQLLKSLIAYFREVQASYETRAKALTKLQNTASNIANPSIFATHNGLGEATRILDDYHKHSVTEANKSRDIEDDVIGALTGLRSDLAQKIKEIKNLSGDFKNSVEKEKDLTRRELDKLRAAIEQSEHGHEGAMGKNDPFVVRLGVDRAIEKQIDEENYLHRAYLNLESSGRELESIIVGEIQKAYKALAGILRREGDDAYSVVEDLRSGPITMPRDQEWSQFVHNDPHFVAPDVPLRRIEDVTYPGRDHPAATEIRAGMLERKSKYLKSYTPGWYVLSPTHLHEFKSADKIYTQPPVMSLYLGDQRLGSHSEAGSSSQKFMLKGKQSGGMHKGHNWVFRAESYDTMLAWFNDIKTLTEGSAPERNAIVQRHSRSLSNTSDRRKSMSSDGFADDDADAVPYAADAASLSEQYPAEPKPTRPLPGGRFPSDLQIPRVASQTADSDDSMHQPDARPRDEMSPVDYYRRTGANPYALEGVAAGSRDVTSEPPEEDYLHRAAATTQTQTLPSTQQSDVMPEAVYGFETSQLPGTDAAYQPEQNNRQADAAGLANAGLIGGALSTAALRSHPVNSQDPQSQDAAGDRLAAVNGVSSSARDDDSVKVLISGPTRDLPHHVAAIPREQDNTSGAQAVNPADHAGAGPASAVAAVATISGSADHATSSSAGADPATAAELASVTHSSLVAPRTASTEAVKTAPLVSRQDSSPGLGGLEREGAHETGKLFPKVIRHDTSLSVSKLHVPGEFPPKA